MDPLLRMTALFGAFSVNFPASANIPVITIGGLLGPNDPAMETWIVP
jgi:hypothetical protein